MDIIDIVILLLIAMGAVIGFKQGGIKRLTSFLGTILIFVISWILKDKLAAFLYEYLPFIHFKGDLLGLDTLNILFYELLAFTLIFALLSVIFRILLVITGLIEKILKATIFLSIPSKILGIFVGAIEAYFYIFLALVVLNLPIFNIQMIKESNVANFILKDSIILSSMSEKMLKTYDSVHNLIKDKNNISITEKNEKIIEIFLENKVISANNLDKLIEKNKITIENKNILDKYR